jgi:hypothetical protein
MTTGRRPKRVSLQIFRRRYLQEAALNQPVSFHESGGLMNLAGAENRVHFSEGGF